MGWFERLRSDPRWATALAWGRAILPAALAVVCCAAAVWVWHQNRAWAQRAALPLRDPLANLNQVGLNVDLTRYGAAEREQVLARLEAQGLVWVRQRFPWDLIEGQRGSFDWSPWDELVEACAAHHLRLIAVLDGAPAWARPAEAADNPLTPPLQVADWGAFAGRLAGRYRGQIAAYQLWNEPNLTTHWGERYVDPVAYVGLLREGAIRIRDADPGAVILLAALAPTTEQGPLNLDEVSFLRQVLRAGGRPFFDVVTLEPYGFADPPDAPAGAERLNFARAAYVRREMVAMGLADCPVWATAWGWNHLPPDWDGEPGPWPSVGAEEQAGYTVEALDMARRDWPWMGLVLLYTYQPDLAANDPRWGFALVDPGGEPTLLYERLAAYQAATPVLYEGVYAAGEGGARWEGGAHYEGAWRFSSAGADPPHGASAEARNAVLSFDWAGTALDLTVRRGDFWGVLYVTVDGRPANGLPRDEEGRAYLVLYDPLGQTRTVNVAHGLSAQGGHHVEIVADGGWGQWPLVGWIVRRESARPPPRAMIGLLLVLGAVLGGAALVQVQAQPQVHRPLYAAVERAFRSYRALPEWVPVVATVGTALAWVAAPWTALSLPLLAAWFLLALLRIDLGLATVAMALPFYLKPKIMLGRPFSVVEVGVWLCALAWLVARLLDRGRAAVRDGRPRYGWLGEVDRRLRDLPRAFWRGWTALDKGMLALVLVAWFALGLATLSTAEEPLAQEAQQAAVREFRTVFLESALFYALLRLAVRSPRARRRVIEGWLLGAAAVSALALAQLVAGRNLITAEGVWRVRGFYGSPNNLALYLERALAMLLALAWSGVRTTPGVPRTPGERQARDARLPWFAYGAAALLVLAALICTLSRGALLLGLPALLLALPLLQRDRRASWIVAAGLAAAAVLVGALALGGVLPGSERIRTLVDPAGGTAFFRLKLWRSTLSMIADHPVTGVGLDRFLYLYRSRYILPSARGEPDLSHPHNLLLDAWTRLGLSGVVVMAVLLVAFFRAAWRQLQTAAAEQRAEALGLIAAMVAALAHGFVDQSFWVTDLAFVFSLLLALAGR